MPSIKGTASVSDDRALQKLLRSTKFPSNFSQQVDYSKIHQPIIKKWISDRITQLLGFEDDIVQSTAINLFLPSSSAAAATSIGTASTSDTTTTSGTHCSSVDPRKAQLDLQGFLGEAEAAEFSRELWTLLLEAQVSPNGVPRAILEQKKRELLRQQQTRQAAGAVARVAATPTVDVARMVQEATRRAEAVRLALVKSHPSSSITAAAATTTTTSSSSGVAVQQHSRKQPINSAPPYPNSSMIYPPQPKEEAVRVEKFSSADKVHNGRDYSTNANGTDDDTTTVISSRSRASRSSSRSNANNMDNNSNTEEEERRRHRKKRKKRERKESRRSRRTRSVSPPAVATGTYKRAYRHEDDDDNHYYYEKKRSRRCSTTSDDSTNDKHGSGGNNDYKITEKRKKSSSSHRRRHHDRYSSKDRESTSNRRRT
jgi:serine/arginine repetitive matrix protein 1